MKAIRKYTRCILGVGILCVLGFIGYRSIKASPYMQGPETIAEEKKENHDIADASEVDLIDINSATAEELAALPDIGQKRAEDIIDLRNKMCGFYTVDDLLCVEGIGYKILDNMRNLITANK